MVRDIIDDRLLGALHVRAMRRSAFDHDPAIEHVAFQAGTLDALMRGQFDGDATIGEILAKGDLGIGTIQRLDGELIVVDGRALVIDGDGDVREVSDDTMTPFAVVCRFDPFTRREIGRPLGLRALYDLVDAAVTQSVSVVAIRVDGDFRELRLRSVRAQRPPYPPLSEVTRHQTEWAVPAASGTVVGFRFPERVAGVEVPGYHLHFLSDDRTRGGHVLDLTVLRGHASIDGGDELHVELPDGIDLGTPGVADRAAIRAVEGG